MNDSLEHSGALAKAAKEEMMILIGDGFRAGATRVAESCRRAIAQTALNI